MRTVYIFGGFVFVAVATVFGSWVLFIIINGMRKRIARINNDRKNRRSIRGY